MAIGLAAVSAIYVSPFGTLKAVPANLLVILAATAATLVGAWIVAGTAVQPLREITEHAARIEAGTLDQRIVTHADTEEFRGLVAVLNRMLERLDAAFGAQRRLVRDVGHELRTPLTTLQGQIEVALRAPRTAREYELVLRSALDEIECLTTVTEDLLLITRAESHLLALHPAPTNPNAVVHTILSPLRRRIVEKDLTLEEFLDPTAQPISVDPVLVGRLVEHLLDNAVKYTPIGGRIIVRTEASIPATKGVRLVVENSGPGLAVEDLPHVFEPFYRADEARTRGEGTGLGLALVAAIARLHGGTARVMNESGEGVRFEVDLPALSRA